MYHPSELSLGLVITPLICTCLSVSEYVSCLGLERVACHSRLPMTPEGQALLSSDSLYSTRGAQCRAGGGGGASPQPSCSTSNNLASVRTIRTLPREFTLKRARWVDDQFSPIENCSRSLVTLGMNIGVEPRVQEPGGVQPSALQTSRLLCLLRGPPSLVPCPD